MSDDEQSDGPFSLLSVSSEEGTNRSFVKRTFGKMDAGAMRGAIFTLAATAMGAGYLAIPQVMEYSGVALGLLLISFCGFLNYLSLRTVSRACFKVGKNQYSTACHLLLGKAWSVVLEIAIIFNAIGLIIALNIIVGDLIPSILSSCNVHLGRIAERDIVLVLLNTLVVAPLGMMRKLGALRFKALFNVVSLTYVLCVIVFEFPYYIPDNNYRDIKYFSVNIDFYQSFSLGMFAFLCHQNLARMQEELRNSNEKRMDKVAFRSIALMDTLFSMLSLFGYLSLFNNIPDIIVSRDPPSRLDNDWAMVVAKVLVTLTISIAIPINLSPCRLSIEKFVFKVEEKSPLWMHLSITFTIILGCLLVAIFYPNITLMFSFLGGFCAAVMALIIPAMLYVKLSDKPIATCKNRLIITLSWVLSIIAFTSVVINLDKAIRK